MTAILLNTFEDYQWQVVSSKRPVFVGVYKEKKTRIYYILFKNDINDALQKKNYVIPTRAVVQLKSNHFVFVNGHYSSEGDLCVKDFTNNYTFVRTLDLSKIKTETFEANDPRLVSCEYHISIPYKVF